MLECAIRGSVQAALYAELFLKVQTINIEKREVVTLFPKVYVKSKCVYFFLFFFAVDRVGKDLKLCQFLTAIWSESFPISVLLIFK